MTSCLKKNRDFIDRFILFILTFLALGIIVANGFVVFFLFGLLVSRTGIDGIVPNDYWYGIIGYRSMYLLLILFGILGIVSHLISFFLSRRWIKNAMIVYTCVTFFTCFVTVFLIPPLSGIIVLFFGVSIFVLWLRYMSNPL
jgi:hypothetical protein